MLRFERWGLAFDQWLEGMGTWTALQGGTPSFLTPSKLLAGHESVLHADTIAPQATHNDSSVVAAPGLTAEALAGDPPVVWLLPESGSPAGPVLPLATSGGGAASAA